MFVFRTDASLDIGTGHVMRCLALAQALRARGATCQFVCRDSPGNLITMVRERGFTVAPLPQSAGGDAGSCDSDWMRDAEQTVAALRGHTAQWMIVDHYALDARWERVVRPVCRQLMVIDDLANRPHECEILLDQNLHSQAEPRYRALTPASCKHLLGPVHALLSSAFDQPATRARSGQIGQVLIYFGGDDRHNQAGKAALAVTRFPTLSADVVLGMAHPFRKDIMAAGRRHPQLRVVDYHPDMAQAMAQADLALGTCGVAAWERCTLGLPSLVCINADNQREDALILDQLGAVENLGDAGDLGTGHWEHALGLACAEPARMARMGLMAATVVAGHAANRRLLIEQLLSSHGH